MTTPATEIYYHDITPRRARRGPLAIVSLAMIALLGAAIVGQADGDRALDRETLGSIDLVSYDARALDDALGRACAVTGCDAVDLSDLFHAGLPAMEETDLAEAEALTRQIAASSEEALRALEARGNSQPDQAARLKAQAEADAAVARYHAAERARRLDDYSG